MENQRSFLLHGSEQRIPALGLGTWKSKPGEVAEAVCHAIKSGYRHIDAAWAYRNEKEVGQGIRDSGINRSELWITSKLFEYHHEPEQVPLALEDTLKNLGVEYLDLYLMHWPICQKPKPNGAGQVAMEGEESGDGKPATLHDLCEDHTSTWKAMEKLVDAGKVRNLGLSNFNIRRTRKLMQSGLKHPITANQVEISLQNPQPDLVNWLQKHNIVVEAYSPLGSTGAALREDPVIAKLAEKHGVDPATILISWPIARGIVVLPKSVTPKRIESNGKVIDLSREDCDAIMKRAQEVPRKRVCDQSDDFGVDIFEDNHAQHNDIAQSKLD